MEYKVTEKDLIGDIEYFPIEVVEKMIEEQVEQDNDPDVSVFQKDRSEIKENGGFSWCETADGETFWSNVADYKDFNLFFQKYPKQKQLTIQKDMETNKLILNGITLPTDTEVKVSVEEGTTIITFQKQESEEQKFKNGDIIYSEDCEGRGWVSIFNRIEDDAMYSYADFGLEDKNTYLHEEGLTYNFGSMDEIFNIRLATKEEIAEFNKEFTEQQSFKWNAEELKFEPIRWRSEYGGKYWYITSNGVVDYAIDNYKPTDNLYFNLRNYFETPEIANKALPLWKDFFKSLSL